MWEPVNVTLKMTVSEARNGRLSTVTSSGEPPLDPPTFPLRAEMIQTALQLRSTLLFRTR